MVTIITAIAIIVTIIAIISTIICTYIYIHMIHAYTISNSSGVLFPVVGADTSLPWKHLIHIWAPIYSLCVIPWKIIKFQSEIHLQKSSMKKYLWCITVWNMFFSIEWLSIHIICLCCIGSYDPFHLQQRGAVSGTLESASCPRIRRRPMSWPPRTHTKQGC